MIREDINRKFEGLFHDVPPVAAGSAEGKKSIPASYPVDVRLTFENLFKVERPVQAVAPPSPPQAPVISIQPENRTKHLLQTASFFVQVSGDAPLTLQWRRDGENLGAPERVGAEGEGCRTFSSRYSYISKTLNDNGAKFDCVVTNSVGSVTSEVATLLLKRAPEKTPSEHAMAFLQTRNSVIKLIKSKERKIKKGTYDFKKEEAAEARVSHFDPHQFYYKYRVPTDLECSVSGAVGASSDDDTGDIFDGFSALAALAGTGYRVRTLDKSDPSLQGHRPDTPAWLLDKRCLDNLLLRLANKKMKPSDRFIEGVDVRPAKKDREDAAGLDYQILYSYYMERCEDSEIFERFEEELREETGRKRITSSVGAVQRRRDRLVKVGNALFLPPPKNI